MPCNDFSLRMNWISKKWRERENLSTGDVRWVALNRWLVRSLFKQKWNGGLGIFLTNNNVHSLPWRVSQQRNLIMLIAVINIWEQNRILQRCFVVVDHGQEQEYLMIRGILYYLSIEVRFSDLLLSQVG